MREVLIARLAAELKADRDGKYAGKTPAELAELINNGWDLPPQAPVVNIVSRPVGIGTVLATVPEGGKFLDTLVGIGTQNRDVYWAMELVKAGTLDIGMEATRMQMKGLAAAVPEIAEGITALLALAEETSAEPAKDLRADAPVLSIILGLTNAPNAITAFDVLEAQGA